MATYTIDKGDHDWKPKDGLGIISWNIPLLARLKKSALVVGITFHDNCLYDFGDEDQHDWNKLPGVSLELFSKNRNSVMAVWRSRPDLGRLEVTSYANWKGEKIVGWDDGDKQDRDQVFWRVEPRKEWGYIIWADERNEFNVKVFNKRLHLKPPSQQARYQYPDLNPWLYTPVGVWFGGNRQAIQRMSMDINRSWIKKYDLKRQGLI